MSVIFKDITNGQTLYQRQHVTKRVKRNGRMVSSVVISENPVTIIDKFQDSALVQTASGVEEWHKSKLSFLYSRSMEQDREIRKSREMKHKNRRDERRSGIARKSNFLNEE